MELIRLQKVIARAGLASRRAAEEMIRQGRVAVNGEVITELGVRVDPRRDEVRVDAQPLPFAEEKAYVLLYKPRQCVTTLKDPQGRRTVADFMTSDKMRLFPVGRLDYDAEGLLLLTNDGPLAHRLQHPRYGVHKTYEIKVKGQPDERALHRLRSGILLKEGVTARTEVTVLRVLPTATWLQIVLHQGWYRQLKRMGEAVGHRVLKIKRTGYGFLQVGKLTPGASRPLSAEEVRRFYELVLLQKE